MNGLASLASLASPAVLIVAGYLAGRLLPVATRPRHGGGSRAGRVVGALIALPIAVLTALILLAKLFDSAVLGWMFGLGLMLCVLLVPCAAFAALGWGLGRRGARQRAGASAAALVAKVPAAKAAPATAALPCATGAALAVRLERDDVHASDTEGLGTWLDVDATTSLSGLLGRIAASRFLPGISGGRATWVVESPAHGGAATGGAIGVIAQQWAAPVLIAADPSVSAHFASVTPWLRLRYRGQRDPADVVAELRAAAPADATRNL